MCNILDGVERNDEQYQSYALSRVKDGKYTGWKEHATHTSKG